jgi:hypothetical protein
MRKATRGVYRTNGEGLVGAKFCYWVICEYSLLMRVVREGSHFSE